MIGTLVKGSGLTHAFPGTGVLFEDLEFEIAAGETVALVGPSGSGKSTLLSIIAGWVIPGAGKIERHAVETIAWVFQNPHGVARRTAIDHVVLPLLAHGIRRGEAVERATEILAMFQLSQAGDREFRALSGGESQRLMLARAVAIAPDLLLVDEPTAQLDMRTAHTVNTVLAAVAGEHTAVVVATHDPQTRDACSRTLDLARYQGISVRGTGWGWQTRED